MPDPIVIPTTTVIAPNRPRLRGRPPFPVGVPDMCLWYSTKHLGASAAKSGDVRRKPAVESEVEGVHLSA
jgi:hypothetical protein